MKKEIVYSIGGIANSLNDVTDVCKLYIENKKRIVINTSAQPNSIPHIGSLITLMSAFAFGKKVKEKYNCEVSIKFDELENSTGMKVKIKNKNYVYSLEDTKEGDGRSKAEINMLYFIDILERLKTYSGIDYSIRKYKDYQQEPIVRKTIIRLFNEYDYFAELLNPKDQKLHIRVPCPRCGIMDKEYSESKFIVNEDKVIIKTKCPEHDIFQTMISENGTDYFDMNTQLRDLTKGALFNPDNRSETLYIMFDGGDWSGIWTNRIHVQGLLRLRYTSIPLRIYAPMLLDWSGGKLSKSLYIENNAYDYLQHSGFFNYTSFLDKFGERGLRILWKEISSWVEEPKKFFRNYSIEYLELVLKNNLEGV